ncbi:hypothetical protein AYI69_g751 [Smittium culicis]|uniref:Hexosyltransferase n=1 Tax=Smittium culicis TaxID=133412 RepID=A0A1R1YSA7_9FUNG|nr:hypothetical protein AYI69_g751 [Smittium culicis]
MDLDTYIDKKYILSVLKFMSDNSEKRIYFGKPVLYGKNVYFEGRFYAMTKTLVRDFCRCSPPPPQIYPEDVWLSHTVLDCVAEDKTILNRTVHYMISDDSKIHHKKYKRNGVDLNLGSYIKA